MGRIGQSSSTAGRTDPDDRADRRSRPGATWAAPFPPRSHPGRSADPPDPAISTRRGRVSSHSRGIAPVPRAAPSRAPVRQATESESPRIRAAFSTAIPRSEDQRRAAATANPRALPERQPPSPGGIIASSSQSSPRSTQARAPRRLSATVPPRLQGPSSAAMASCNQLAAPTAGLQAPA